MENQYCRVGAVTPITSEQQSVAVLEYMYQNFLEKASALNGKDSRLVEFFEHKAQKIKRILEDLV